MTVYYLDPVGGNDANAGTSFATRWQSFTSGATFSRVVAGDEIRVIASDDPTSLSQSATWTNGSATITLTSAVTQNIYASGAWTAASTNVTITTSTNRKLGSNCVSISPNATFTTGKAAYLTIANTDFSAYEQVSFWINMTSGSMTADGDISLRLCSDTLGNTTVNTISVPRIRATSRWQAYTVNLSGALGSSIQSIALYIEVDRGAQTFLVNNVLACKSKSSADSLSLISLIGKNSTNDPWLPIQSINGTAVVISPSPNTSVSNTGTPTYSGVSETVTAYKRDPIQLPSAFVGSSQTTAVFGTINFSGNSSNPITISGGWNTTDMSTQTGDTYISGVNGFGAGGITMQSIASYINISKLNYSKFNSGFQSITTTSFENSTLSGRDFCDMTSYAIYIENTGGTTSSTRNQYSTFTITNITSCGEQSAQHGGISLIGPVNNVTFNVENLNSNNGNGLRLSGTGGQNFLGSFYTMFSNTFNITNINRNAGSTVYSNGAGMGVALSFCNNNIFNLKNLIDNVSIPLYLDDSCSNVFNFDASGTITSSGGSSWGLTHLLSSSENVFKTNGAYFQSGNSPIIATVTCGKNIMYNPTISAANGLHRGRGGGNFTLVSPSISGGSQNIVIYGPNSSFTISNYGGVTTDQRTYYGGLDGGDFGRILTNTSIRHTASGISWQMISGGTGGYLNASSTTPLTLPLAQIAVNASSLVTVKVWVYRTSTSLTTRLVCPGGQIAGVSSDVVATASGAINTWEQLTITFTPSAAGVVGLQVQCYGAAASVYVDDFEATQA
jgi:hypothetical protein